MKPCPHHPASRPHDGLPCPYPDCHASLAGARWRVVDSPPLPPLNWDDAKRMPYRPSRTREYVRFRMPGSTGEWAWL